MPSTQVAVRIPDELLETLDWFVEHRGFESRGAAMRSALESQAKVERSREVDMQIRRAYELMPETDDERVPEHRERWTDLDDEDWSGW